MLNQCIFFSALIAIAVCSSCSIMQRSQQDYLKATCTMENMQVTGNITLWQKKDGSGQLEIEVKLKGFDGVGTHGFHLHEGDSCTATGGYLYVDGNKIGSLESLEANGKGQVLQCITSLGTLFPGDYYVIGRVLVAHLKPNGGDRLGCCVIQTT